MEQESGGSSLVVVTPQRTYDAAEMGWSSGVALMASLGAVGFSVWALVANGGTADRVDSLESRVEEIDEALEEIHKVIAESKRRWERLRDDFDSAQRQLDRRLAELAR
jgi:uncharacterized coiled-coil protein SlyX